MTVGAGQRQFVIRVNGSRMFTVHRILLRLMAAQAGLIRITLQGDFRRLLLNRGAVGLGRYR
ncbi:hypothetical protein D3C78_1466890 [compost metagenome]